MPPRGYSAGAAVELRASGGYVGCSDRQTSATKRLNDDWRLLMAGIPLQPPRGFMETARRDTWWVQPAVVFVVLASFVVYATWAAFQGEHYHWGPYLSPFYSPELWGSSPHALF